MEPTPEQQQAIDLFQTGGSLAIEAGAGTGKTSTLVMLAKTGGNALDGQYVAFNKALVEESRAKFPLTVACNTAHSLAFKAKGRDFKPRLDRSERMPGYRMAQILGVSEPLEVQTFDGKPKALHPGFLAGQAQKAVELFCQSADDEIKRKHVPFVEGLDPISQLLLAEAIVPLAHQMWKDLQQPYGGWMPFRHSHYLKMWQLDDPYINADFILFDESQDANPVIAAIIAEQSDHAQLVYVGDSQQEIYGWTGAVNALSRVEVKHRTFLTQSFRFGQAIADKANEVLDLLGAELRLSGNPAIDSRVEAVESPRAILTRTNATGVTWLLKLQEDGRKAHLVGGQGEVLNFARGAEELMQTGHSNHPDLVCFDSWNAVQEYARVEAGGEDLRLLVRLMDEFGSAEIIAGLEKMPSENRAEIIISTAHKSKGREWSSVKLTKDFPERADSEKADLRLLYVAMTRAKEALDMTSMSPAPESEDLELAKLIEAEEGMFGGKTN